MREPVPARVVGRIAEAEVRAQVDDGGAARGQVGHDLRRGPVREREEDGVRVRHGGVHVEPGAVKVNVGPADRLPVPAAPHQAGDLDVRMAREEADQLRADVAGRAHDRDADSGVRGARLARGGHPTRHRNGPPARHGRDDGPGGRAHGRTRPLTGGSPGSSW